MVLDTKDENFSEISDETFRILEKERVEVSKKISNLFKTFIISSSVFLILSLFCLVKYDSGLLFFILFALNLVLYEIIEKKIVKNIRLKFKKEVICKIIKSINPKFVYIMDKHISKNEILKTGILDIKNCGFFSGNDLISGVIDSVKFRMSDICYEENRQTGNGSIRISIFKGIVFVADFYKNFNSHTFIISSNYTKKKGQKITLDNVNFNSKFQVFTDNKINAFYILDPVFMEKILKLTNKFQNIDMVFYKNKIYCFINNNKDNFEIDIDTPLLNAKMIFSLYKYNFDMFFGIVKELNLNNKIFKKS